MSESDHDSPHAVRNPSPPPELEQKGQNIFDDNIDNTAFSKHWLFTTLMKLIQEVDKENENQEDTEFGVDIDDELQNELCRLWDMAMNPDVAKFLHEFRAVEILSGVIGKSKAPRVTEICVGILGNMACDDEICIAMSENEKLIQMSILLLESPDPPTLVEITRLLYTCLSNAKVRAAWLTVIKQSERLHDNVLFILHSSTNSDLLNNTAEFVDKVLDEDDELCLSWTSQEFVVALLEAVKQIGYTHSGVLETFLHIFQLLSTSDKGVQALVSCSDDVLVPLLKYLMGICEYEIVGLEGRESCLSSAISVVSVLLTSSPDAADKLTSEPDFIRYLLKILEPTFDQLHEELQDSSTECDQVSVMDSSFQNRRSLQHGSTRATVTESDQVSVMDSSFQNRHSVQHGSTRATVTESDQVSVMDSSFQNRRSLQHGSTRATVTESDQVSVMDSSNRRSVQHGSTRATVTESDQVSVMDNSNSRSLQHGSTRATVTQSDQVSVMDNSNRRSVQHGSTRATVTESDQVSVMDNSFQNRRSLQHGSTRATVTESDQVSVMDSSFQNRRSLQHGSTRATVTESDQVSVMDSSNRRSVQHGSTRATVTESDQVSVMDSSNRRSVQHGSTRATVTESDQVSVMDNSFQNRHSVQHGSTRATVTESDQVSVMDSSNRRSVQHGSTRATVTQSDQVSVMDNSFQNRHSVQHGSTRATVTQSDQVSVMDNSNSRSLQHGSTQAMVTSRPGDGGDEMERKPEVVHKPCGDVNKPCGDVNRPCGDVNRPRGDVNRPRGDVNRPRGDVNRPRGDVNRPRGDVNRARGDVNRPRGDVNRPRGDVNRPRGDVNRPCGDVNRPRGDVNRPRGDVNRPCGDVNRQRISTLCGILHACLSDFILALKTDEEMADASPPLFLPVLHYLNNSCSRRRISIMLQLLRDGDHESSLANLRQLAEKYNQTRLTSIIARYCR